MKESWTIKSETLSDGSETFNIHNSEIDIVLHAKNEQAALRVAACLEANTVD